jgi:mannosyltransferase
MHCQWVLADASLQRMVLGAILVLSCVLTVYRIGAQSLWIDEATSLLVARLSPMQIISERATSVNPPLYFLLLHAWLQLFGETEFALRLPSAFFGVAGIAMIYRMGADLFDKTTGLIAAVLLCLSPFYLYFEQEARAYTLMTLLTLISTYGCIGLIRGRAGLFTAGYIVSSVLLLYTHFYGLLVVLAQNVYILATVARPQSKLTLYRWLAIQAIIVLLYLPWIVVLVQQLLIIRHGYWLPRPTVKSIVETFLAYTGQSRSLLLICTALVSLAAWRALQRSGATTYRGEILSLLLGLLVLVLVPFAVSQVFTPIYYTRYTISAALALYLMMARGIVCLDSRWARALTLAVILLLFAKGTTSYYSSVTKAQWREATHYLEIEARPSDLLLFNDGGELGSTFAYYAGRSDLRAEPFDFAGATITEQSASYPTRRIEELDAVVRGHDRVWLVISRPNDSGQLARRLTELYGSPTHTSFVRIDIFRFEAARQ